MSITTAGDLVTSTLRLLGVIGGSQTPSADQQDTGLDALNMLTGSFNTNILDCFKITDLYTALTPKAVQDPPLPFTIGPTATDIIVARPVAIELASLVLTSTSPDISIPLELFDGDLESWMKIQVLNVGTSIPMKMYYDRNWPNGNIYLWPYLNAAATLRLGFREMLDDALTWNSTLSLPPGYLRFLKFNLAVEVAPEFQREPSPTVVDIAEKSKAAIEALNSRTPEVLMDPSLGGQDQYGWNYLTGQYNTPT